MRYARPKSGEWFRPIRKGWKLCCCDCGLVHKMETKVLMSGNSPIVLLRGERDYRATALTRRQSKYAFVRTDVERKMPSKTAKQGRAMRAAAAGKSNLGIPKKVGKEFVKADEKKAKRKGK